MGTRRSIKVRNYAVAASTVLGGLLLLFERPAFRAWLLAPASAAIAQVGVLPWGMIARVGAACLFALSGAVCILAARSAKRDGRGLGFGTLGLVILFGDFIFLNAWLGWGV